jgi:LysM repeat protein
LEVAPVEAAAIEVEALPMLAGAEPFPHPVRMGDTLDSLARDYSTLKSEIMRLNNLSEDAVLRPGQTVLIPSN